MAQKFRWGILGTGNIARKFAAQIQESSHSEIVAVGSRSAASAESFSRQWNCRACASYPELLEREDVEAVYISLPNALHREWGIRTLEAHKHVLCEKPLANSASEASEMFEIAERSGRRLAEAFMYRCHPAVIDMFQTIAEGVIGDVRIIRTNFTYNRPADPQDIRYQRHLGGGALMDIGCYCINLIQALTNQTPAEVGAVAHFHETGVDDYTTAVLRYENGILASMTCGMNLEADRTTFINGTTGYLQMETPWFSNGTYDVVRGDLRETRTRESKEALYALEAEAFTQAVRSDRPLWISPDETIRNMKTLDNIRAAIGLSFH